MTVGMMNLGITPLCRSLDAWEGEVGKRLIQSFPGHLKLETNNFLLEQQQRPGHGGRHPQRYLKSEYLYLPVDEK